MTVPFRQLWLTSVSAGVFYLALASHALADDFVVDGPETTTQTVDGDDTLTITEDGSITTTGLGSSGVESSGANNIIINDGVILTSGTFAAGIYHDSGANVLIVNNGTLDVQREGIRNSGGDAVIINNGTIQSRREGIYNSGDDAVITNNGTVLVDGDGIRNVSGAGAAIVNNGTIQSGSRGIFNTGDDGVVITNNAAILAEDDGIYNSGNDAVITNNGTTLSEEYGIYNSGDDAVITNNATILAEEDGIYNFMSVNAVITNRGEIRTDGSGKDGIFDRNGTGTTINNTGLLISELNNAIRVGAGSSGTTVNLGAPSYIGGEIFFGSSSTLNITTGASHSILWQLPDASVLDGGAPNFSGSVPWFYDAATGEFATFDPTGLTASFNQLADTANTLARVGRYGLRRARSGTGAESTANALLGYDEGADTDDRFDILLATNSGPETAYGPASGRFWITGFGGYANHDGDDGTLDQRIDQIGAALGYAWQQTPDARLSVVAGYMYGTITAESPWADAQDIDSNGVFAGVYGDKRFGPVTLGFGVSGGWQTNDSTRFVNDNLATSGGLFTGESTASSSYDSWFVTPEASLSADIGLGPTGLILTPTMRGRYALQRTGSYTESGSNANATVDDHTLGVVEGDFELALSRSFQLVTLTARAGYLLRNSAGNDDVPVTLLGITNSVGLGATDRSTGYLGASLDLDLGPQASFTLDGQGYLSDDVDALEGMARLAIRF